MSDTPTFRDLIEAAAESVDTLKYPDTSEFAKRMDPVLKAAGQGQIGGDTVTNISIHDGTLYVDTEYTVRGCSQTGRYKLPMALLDSADPEHAAQVWKLEQDIKASENAMAGAKAQFERMETRVAELKNELEALKGGAA